MSYMLGVDIGTQTIRAFIYDEAGNCVGKSVSTQYVDSPKPLWATQKASSWWDAVIKNIRSALADSGLNAEQIVSVGTDAIMHSPVPVSKEGKVLEDDIQLYCDKRASYIAEALKPASEDDAVYQMTANMPTSSWYGIKIKWIEEHNKAIYDKTWKFVTPKDFINFKFTGEACIDQTEASGSYLMDKRNDEWSDILIANLGLDKEKLPKIAHSYEVIGKVTKAAAEATGLKEGTSVVCGGGDMLCALYTSGLSRQGNVVDLTGTGSNICYYAKKPIMDKRVMNLRHVIDGWVPFGNVDSSGGTLRWFRDVLAKDEAKYAKGKDIDEYAYLDKLAAETSAGADGMLFFPYLMGERTMGSANSRGVFIGINLGTKTGHLARALLEGVAFEHKRTIDIFEKAGNKIEAVYHIGGGAKSNFWSQIKADIYGKPVYTLKRNEGSVLGAALLSGVGMGIYKNATEAADMVTQVNREYLPNAKLALRYGYLYDVYCKLHDSLQPYFAELANAPEK